MSLKKVHLNLNQFKHTCSKASFHTPFSNSFSQTSIVLELCGYCESSDKEAAL